MSAGGQVVKVNNGIWSRMAKRVNATVPIITAENAMSAVLRKNGIAVETLPSQLDGEQKEKWEELKASRLRGQK